MESRWRNLIVLFAIVVIALAVFFLAPLLQVPSLSFEQGVTEIDRIWVQSGVDYATISAQEISRLSPAEIDTLEQRLSAYQASVAEAPGTQGAALRDYAEIQLLFARELKERNRLSAIQDTILTVDAENVCDRVADAEALASTTENFVAAALAADERVTSFTDTYPELVAQTTLTIRQLNRAAIQQSLAETELALEELRDTCGQ